MSPAYGYHPSLMTDYHGYGSPLYDGNAYENYGYDSRGFSSFGYGNQGFPVPGFSNGWDPFWQDTQRGVYGYRRNQDFRFNNNGQEFPNKQNSFGLRPGLMHSFSHVPYLNGHPINSPSASMPSGTGGTRGVLPSPQSPPLPPPPSSSSSSSGISIMSAQRPPGNSVGSGFVLPLHGPEFGPNNHPNSIIPPFHQPFSQDRCKFPTSPGVQGTVFHRVGFGARFRNTYVFKVIRAERLEDCEKACLEARDYTCRSFNYRNFATVENCELSQFDTKQFKLDNPAHFEQSTQYDYYERDTMNNDGPGFSSADCIEVAQTCTPDGMEFTLKTPEGFYGRIYTYGYYDSCFYDGNGGSVSVLRISRANGFPRCGTQQYGDAMTNIVVVQFSDYVQTSRDKKYNLTCYFSGPGEAVVTSNYLDAKTDG